ncbi:hypothetical protein ACFVT1_26960, partial [Streptomyces sp. NPDC057963]
MADRRLLLVVDNATAEEQVRPLLPGTSGCGVLITGRGRLAAVEGIRSLDLDELSDGESRQLLGRIVGEARMAAEPGAVSMILEQCAGHPLALRIRRARLAARLAPHCRHIPGVPDRGPVAGCCLTSQRPSRRCAPARPLGGQAGGVHPRGVKALGAHQEAPP